MISVLYVDDEQVLLDICKIYLERTGELKIQTETSAKKAIERLSYESFDAIVSDYQMPDMDGIEFLKVVRVSGNTVPFIIFTGRGREEIAIAALKEGADFYLQKGGDPRSQFAELANQIKQIVRQRKAESSVRESEQMYRALFESAPDAIFLMESDRIIDCNRHTELLFGRTKEEILGHSPVDFSPPYQPDGSLSFDLAHTYINTALAGDDLSFEWRCIRIDGTHFDTEIRLNRISTNRGFVLLSILRDITKRKNDEIELVRKNEEISASYEELMGAEEELREQYKMLTQSEQRLRESEEKLHSTLASMDDLVFTLDSEGIFQDLFKSSPDNPFFKREEFVGRSFRNMLSPDLSDLLNNAIERVKGSGEPEQIDYSLPLPQGITYYNARLSRRLSATGEFAGITLVARDVTLQKEAETALVEHEAKLNAIIQGSPIPQFIIGTDHRVTHWNTALTIYSGIKAEEVLGTDTHWRAFYPEQRPCLADLLIEGDVQLFEQWYNGKYKTSPLIPDAYIAFDFFPHMGVDGVWLSFTAALIHDRHGEVIGAVETLEDITEQKHAVMEIHRMTQFQESIIMNANVWLMVLDAAGKILIWNHAAEEMSGYQADEVVGRSLIWKALYPDSEYRNTITRNISGIIKENRFLQDFQTTIRTKNGETKDILWNTRVIHEDHGPDRFVAIGIDITGRIRAEKALYEKEVTLRAIVKGSPIPQFVIDKNHRLIHWNTALEKYSGIRAEEVIGTDQQWRAFFPDKHPCIADLLLNEDDSSLKDLDCKNFEPSPLIEGGYQGTDFFPTMGTEGSWLFFTAAPVRDDKGLLIGAVETLEDITGRKKAEYALMESEERFRTLFTHANDAIFLHRITKEGLSDLFIEVNETACKRLGYTREELLTMSPQDLDAMYSPVKEIEYFDLLRKDGHVTFEAMHLTKNNSEIPVEISAHMYEFRGEKVVLSIVRDISERKRYESAIQNANTKLNLLSSITRHDILNQLTALTGYLDLSEDITDDTKILDYIWKEKKVADTILRQILFTRDYQTIGVQSPQWQNLKNTIYSAAGLLDRNNIALTVHLDDTEIFADPLLEKVFFNLIDNSIRYGEGLTTIDFSAEPSNSGLILICSDDGGGVPSAEKENIFNRKYFSNTGFGLFLSREILSITGLTITETGTFGIGARFEIFIPNGSFRL